MRTRILNTIIKLTFYIIFFLTIFIVTPLGSSTTNFESLNYFKKNDFHTLRILIDNLDPLQTNLNVKGINLSLRYSTNDFPSIYQGGFSLANQITILSLNPILKFFYDFDYSKINTLDNYKDLLILSSNCLEYKNRKYRGKFLIANKNGQYYLINLVDIEDYLRSVVPSEMPPSWELEALKAQAIAARTYAIRVAIERRNKNEIFDLYSTVLDQAYYGIDKENPKTDLAIEQTKNLIIVYNGKPIWALYHSNCGGKTLDGKLVFPKRLDPDDNYLISTECPYKGKNWQTQIEIYTLKKILQKLTGNQIYSIDNIYTNNLKTYIVYNRTFIYSLYNWEIRKLVGFNSIRSPYITNFKIDKDIVIVEGVGFGHGVGLCQFGANTLAKNGFNYKEILLHYYQNAKIVQLEEIFK